MTLGCPMWPLIVARCCRFSMAHEACRTSCITQPKEHGFAKSKVARHFDVVFSIVIFFARILLRVVLGSLLGLGVLLNLGHLLLALLVGIPTSQRIRSRKKRAAEGRSTRHGELARAVPRQGETVRNHAGLGHKAISDCSPRKPASHSIPTETRQNCRRDIGNEPERQSSDRLLAAAGADGNEALGQRYHEFGCATERNFWQQRLSELCLNVSPDESCCIYRLKVRPGSDITVSIDRESFTHLNASRDDLNHLEDSLTDTLEELNRLALDGANFRFVRAPERGLVVLEHGGNVASRGITWAMSGFPRPGVPRYSVKIYMVCFRPEYRESLGKILCHEFAHLLGMRHSDTQRWEAERSWRPSVWYPYNRDEPSIMGSFRHPAELSFHDQDRVWLRQLYALPEGYVIEGVPVRDAMPMLPDHMGQAVNWPWPRVLRIIHGHLQLN